MTFNKNLKMNKLVFFIVVFFTGITGTTAQSIFIEAESFTNKGGWVVDPQFVEQMGSPYLLAHGMGKPVQEAQTNFKVETTGKYHVWVRTKNWAPGNWDAPGRFLVLVGAAMAAKSRPDSFRAMWGASEQAPAE